MFKTLTIKSKLYSVAALALLGMGSMMFSQYYQTGTIQQLNDSRLLLEQINSDMLMLRRNEKDFIARSDIKYQHKFNKNFKALMVSINELMVGLEKAGIHSEKIAVIKTDFQQYSELFNQYVDVQKKIGLNHKSGLYGGL